MLKNALLGLLSSIAFAFLVLLWATKNYLLSLFATFSIGLVLTTIIATIFLLGWNFGMTEQLGMIIFIGFSVDYIVHMSHQYVES